MRRVADFDDVVELLGRYSREVELASALRTLGDRLATGGIRRDEAATDDLYVHKLDQRLPSDVVARIVVEYQAGATSRQLALSHGLSKASVIKLVREAGGAIRPTYRPA